MLPGIRACLEVVSVRLMLLAKTKGKEKVSDDYRGCPVTSVHQGKSRKPYPSGVFIIPILFSFPREGNGNGGVETPMIFHSSSSGEGGSQFTLKRLREAHRQFWICGISYSSSLPNLFCVTSFCLCGPLQSMGSMCVCLCPAQGYILWRFFKFIFA